MTKTNMPFPVSHEQTVCCFSSKYFNKDAMRLMVNAHKLLTSGQNRQEKSDGMSLLCSVLSDHYEYCKTAEGALRQVQFNFLHHSAQGRMCWTHF